MNIPKTPFKLNSNKLVYDVEVEPAGQMVESQYKAIYPDCDIKDCGGSAFYTISFKRDHDEHKGKIYTQNVCERHLIDSIERLGVKEGE